MFLKKSAAENCRFFKCSFFEGGNIPSSPPPQKKPRPFIVKPAPFFWKISNRPIKHLSPSKPDFFNGTFFFSLNLKLVSAIFHFFLK